MNRLKKVNEAVGCLPHENITFCGMWEDVVEEGDCVGSGVALTTTCPPETATRRPECTAAASEETVL